MPMGEIYNEIKSKYESLSYKGRSKIERVLSGYINNEIAFAVSDIGRQRDIDKYDVSLSAFNRYWVSPSEITRMTGREWKPWSNRKRLLGNVKDGDWDKRAPPTPPSQSHYPAIFDERLRYIGFKEYIDGKSWSETEYYNLRVEMGDDQQDIEDKLLFMESLYESISEEGYLTQDELGNHPSNKIKRLINEITVDIGRNGEFLHVDGHHRLEIAKVLELDKVPVVVLVRHKKWMEKVEQFNMTGEADNMPVDHPDMKRCAP